jgi:hypothetical protein
MKMANPTSEFRENGCAFLYFNPIVGKKNQKKKQRRQDTKFSLPLLLNPYSHRSLIKKSANFAE